MAEQRIARAEREMDQLAQRELRLATERDGLRAEIARAVTAEADARAALEQLHAADAADRDRLAEAERAATTAREHLRAADDRLRGADHAALEARLGLESLREGVLVELAGLGGLGLVALGVTDATARDDVDATAPADSIEDDDATAAEIEDPSVLEAALAAVAETWAATPPSESPPGPGRLAQLRRRYHELGAANPFAVDEYAELKVRLEGLETQGADLRTAIADDAGADRRARHDDRRPVPLDVRRRSRRRSSVASSSCSAVATPACR